MRSVLILMCRQFACTHCALSVDCTNVPAALASKSGVLIENSQNCVFKNSQNCVLVMYCHHQTIHQLCSSLVAES